MNRFLVRGAASRSSKIEPMEGRFSGGGGGGGVKRIMPDWTSLPSGPLETIAGKIVKLSDYIRFRSVCPIWRSAAPPSGLSRKQPPILLFAQDPHRDDGALFFCPTTGVVLRPYLPELRGKEVLAVAQGWMLIIDKQSKALSLFNPVSTDQIILPPTSSFANLENAEHYWVPFISSSPSSVGEFVVIVLSSYGVDNLAFCRPGDTHWSKADVAVSSERKPYIAYHEGKFHMLRRYDHLSLVRMEGESILCGAIDGESYYLKLHYQLLDGLRFVTDVRVYKSEFELITQSSEVQSFGRNALFFSSSQLFMVNVEGFPDWKEDCIYFPGMITLAHPENRVSAVYAINLNADLCDYKTWGEHRYWSRNPVWLTPSFC